MRINEKVIEGTPAYAIFLDNIRIDKFVLRWNTQTSISGGMGRASFELIYAPQFYQVEEKDGDTVTAKSAGFEDMTTVRIFSLNMFSGRYQQIFEGNLRGVNRTRTQGGGFSISFTAIDYMNWFNRTIVPLAAPIESSFQNLMDVLRWRTQGIDTDNMATVSTRNDIEFVGKTIKEYTSMIIDKTMQNNKLYSDPNTVAAWDNAVGRFLVMGDIKKDLVASQISDFAITTSTLSINSIYVAFNDIAKNLMFEFYQDIDGIIRFKPPFWNEGVLKKFVIDGSMIMSMGEDTDYTNRVTRVVVSGAQDEYEPSAWQLFLPGAAYVGDMNNGADEYFCDNKL